MMNEMSNRGAARAELQKLLLKTFGVNGDADTEE